jgi:hypothetical protein
MKPPATNSSNFTTPKQSWKPFLSGFGWAMGLVGVIWLYNNFGVYRSTSQNSPSGKFTLELGQVLRADTPLELTLVNNTTGLVTRRATIRVLDSPDGEAYAVHAKVVWGPQEDYVDVLSSEDNLLIRLSTLDRSTWAAMLWKQRSDAEGEGEDEGEGEGEDEASNDEN